MKDGAREANPVQTNDRRLPKPRRQIEFTIDREDLYEEVGITPKMLRDWTTAGLFQPKQGKGTRRFTKDDVAKLKYIKHLRQELGLSIEATLKLMSRFRGYPSNSKAMQFFLPEDPNDRFPFIDVERVELVSCQEAIRTIIKHESRQAATTPNAMVLENLTIQMVINLFFQLSEMHRYSPSVYEAAREGVFESIREAERAVRLATEERIEEHYGTGIFETVLVGRFVPNLKGDPDPEELTPQDVKDLKELKRLIFVDLDVIPF